jgi:DNA modification methylase
VAGNQRILALSLLGRDEEEIEVRVPNRKLSQKEFNDYLLTSNRSGGSWDFEKLARDFDLEELLTAGFDSLDLSNIFDEELEILDDEFSVEKEIEKAQETDIKSGDYFALGRHRLLCSDSQDLKNIEKLMDGKKAKMVNSDFPFNINYSYDSGMSHKKGKYGGQTDDNKSDEEYEKFVETIIKNCLKVSESDAHLMFWCDERYVWLFQSVYKKLGIDSKRLLIWIKNNFSATPKQAFNKVTEFCVYGTVGRPWINDKIKNLHEVQNKDLSNGNRLIDDILDMINIWMIKRLPVSDYTHPTEKSPELHEKSLRRCTQPGDIVLDATAGSGSLMSACEQLKRTVYMNEIEPVFCQVIINRFKQLNPNETIKKLN